MSKGLTYCHICGEILDKTNNFQLVQRDFGTKKEKMLFDICPACLNNIKAMEIPKDRLKLHTSFGKRIWTEKQIEESLSSDVTLFKALKKLYSYQTADEQQTRETKYDNAVGFNKPDSSFLTGMAKKYIAEGEKLDNFSVTQIETVRKKMLKYVSQLTIIANA